MELIPQVLTIMKSFNYVTFSWDKTTLICQKQKNVTLSQLKDVYETRIKINIGNCINASLSKLVEVGIGHVKQRKNKQK